MIEQSMVDRPGSSGAESKKMRERWADPEFRARRIEAIRRGKQAKREKAAALVEPLVPSSEQGS